MDAEWLKGWTVLVILYFTSSADQFPIPWSCPMPWEADFYGLYSLGTFRSWSLFGFGQWNTLKEFWRKREDNFFFFPVPSLIWAVFYWQ